MEVTSDHDSDWVVEIYGYAPEIFRAKNRKQAQYRALQAFREAYGRRYTFAELSRRGIKVRSASDVEVTMYGRRA